MGFRFKRFDYVGGTGTWGTGSTPRSRSEAVLKDMADWLIASETGWGLDTDRNATTSSFVDVPFWNPYTQTSYSSTYDAPALFFVNSTSGCKLFMCVQGNLVGTGCFAPKTPSLERFNSTYTLQLESDNYGESTFGIILSIIPGDSSDEFGSAFDGTTTFLPSSATPMIGTCQGWGYTTTSYPISYIYSNDTGYCFSYTLFATSDVIGINGGFTTNGSAASTSEQKGYFVGKIIGTSAHESALPQALYGLIQFGYCTASSNSEFYTAYTKSRSLGANNVTFAQSEPFTSALARTVGNSAGCIFSSLGGRKMYVYDAASVRWYPASVDEMSDRIQTSAITGATRWVPISIGVVSTDLSANGVIPGDGFKGYLNTTLFRSAICTANQLYADGAFVGCSNNLLLGWDENNTDTL